MAHPLQAMITRQREQQKGNQEFSFGQRGLKQLCKLLKIDTRGIDTKPEFNFDWLQREYPTFPIRLAAKRMELDLPKIIKDLPGSWLWNCYFGALEETNCELLGLIVPIQRGTFYICHNNWELRWAPGYTRIMHKADNNKGIIVEPLASFAASVLNAGAL